MIANDNEGDGTNQVMVTVIIQLDANRSIELKRLAESNKISLEELAKSYLETEIEAQHGLTYGPWLRRYMYRD